MSKLFKTISHGVYVIGVKHEQEMNAFTAAWLMQASFEPPLLVFSINPQHYSYQLLKASGYCAISVLSHQQLNLAELFGQAQTSDKMSKVAFIEAKTNAPIIAESLAYFDCKVSHYSDAGDHQLVICHVVDMAWLNKGKPLLYSETGTMDNSETLFKTRAKSV